MTTAGEQMSGSLGADFDHLRHLTLQEAGLNAGLTALTVIACVGLVWLVQRLMCYALRVIPGLGAPNLSKAERKVHAGKALRLTQLVLNAVIVVGGVFLIFETWGFDPLGWTTTPWGQKLSATGTRVIAVVVIAAVALEATTLFLQYFLSRLKGRSVEARRAAQLNTLGPIFRSAFQIAIIVLAAMTLLSQVGVQIAPLLAGAGVVGIAIGFGAQTLVKDFFTGFFLIIEDIVAVGDVVQIQAFSGTVEEMTLRTIRLRDFDGTLHIFPYGEAQIIHNMTKTYSFSAFDIPVALNTDLDKAMAVMRETFEAMRRDADCGAMITDDIQIVGVDLLSDIGIILKGRIRTQPNERWRVLREYNLRLKKSFDASGIVLTHK